MYDICQVCGNPVFAPHDHGTELGGGLNYDFCSNCYKEGRFYTRDYDGSLDGMPFTPWDQHMSGYGSGFGLFG